MQINLTQILVFTESIEPSAYTNYVANYLVYTTWRRKNYMQINIIWYCHGNIQIWVTQHCHTYAIKCETLRHKILSVIMQSSVAQIVIKANYSLQKNNYIIPDKIEHKTVGSTYDLPKYHMF